MIGVDALRSIPAWVATLGMLIGVVSIYLVGGEGFWEDGYGVALALGVTIGIAWLSRAITFTVYGVLTVVGLGYGALLSVVSVGPLVALLLGAAAMVGAAYIVGDRTGPSAASTDQ